MKKGIVRISKALIQEALNFPPTWNIEELTLNKDGNSFNAVISGDEFPEVVPIKECKLIVHTRTSFIEVESQT